MAIIIGMTLMSGVSWKILLPVFLIIGGLGALLIFLVVYDRQLLIKLGFMDYQFARIDSWLDPFADSRGDAFQLAQSMRPLDQVSCLVRELVYQKFMCPFANRI